MIALHDALEALFGLACHQRPERSFAPGGVHLVVCARCLGLYAGFAAFAAARALMGAGGSVGLPGPSRARDLAHALLIVQGAAHALFAPPAADAPEIRAASGALAAIGMAHFLAHGSWRSQAGALAPSAARRRALARWTIQAFVPALAVVVARASAPHPGAAPALDALAAAGLLVALVLVARAARAAVPSARS